MLGHARMQTPGSPLWVPVSISVNPGGLCALAQCGLELCLQLCLCLIPAEPTQKGLVRRGEAQGCLARRGPLPPVWPNTGSP